THRRRAAQCRPGSVADGHGPGRDDSGTRPVARGDAERGAAHRDQQRCARSVGRHPAVAARRRSASLRLRQKGPAMRDSVRTAFLPFSEPLEARVPFMYLDIKSLVSTGVGNLLDADSSEHFGTSPNPLPDIFTLGWFDKGTLTPAGHEEIEEEYRKVK